MSCRPLDVESFRNRARLPKGITRRKRAGYDESKKVSRTLLRGHRRRTAIADMVLFVSPTSFTSHTSRAYDKSASLFQASASRAQPSVSQTEARRLIEVGRSGLLAFRFSRASAAVMSSLKA